MSVSLELVDLLYRAHGSVGSIVVEYRDWVRPEPSNVLLLEKDEGGGNRIRWQDAGPWPQPIEATRRIWFAPPDDVRVEVVRADTVMRAAVRRGTRWWRWDNHEGESSGDTAEDASVIPPLLDPPLLWPERLLTSLWLEPIGVGSRAGRRVIRARAYSRRLTDANQEMSFQFEFDVEHGTPLYRVSFESGDRVEETEVVAIRYGTTIDPERFAFRVAKGPPSNGSRPAGNLIRPKVSAIAAPPLAPPRVASAKTVWLTGLPGSGKTTIGLALERILLQLDCPCCVLDSDVLRDGLSRDLTYAKSDRGEHARRTAHVAALLVNSGVVAIVALVSPYADDRAQARAIHAAGGLGFVEVWVDTPLEVCERRDTKGLYARARTSDLTGLTGLDAPYEVPRHPDIRVSGCEQHPREVAIAVANKLLR